MIVIQPIEMEKITDVIFYNDIPHIKVEPKFNKKKQQYSCYLHTNEIIAITVDFDEYGVGEKSYYKIHNEKEKRHIKKYVTNYMKQYGDIDIEIFKPIKFFIN